MPGPDLIERIDRAIAELVELRPEVAAEMPANLRASVPDDADDLAPEHLLDTHAAAARFGFPRDTIAKWCREEGIGRKAGGRWLASIPRLARRINGK